VQHVELRRVGEARIGRQPQPAHVAHRLIALGEDAAGGVGDARENLERPGEVDLVQSFEQEGADLEMGVVRNHADEP
jgi:hypothetical protein